MPCYEYECEGGHKFEEYRSIEDRLNAFCPMCKRPVHIKISLTSHRMARPFMVLAHDGTILHQAQTITQTPPPDHRWGNTNLVEV
jgi:putative FmdB family regulatory protein